MTTCEKCLYRKKCMQIQGERKHGDRRAKTEQLCGWCGCIEAACHCSYSAFSTGPRKQKIKR